MHNLRCGRREWNEELTEMVLVESAMRSAAGDEGTNGDETPGRRKVEAASAVDEDEVVEGEAPGLRPWPESNEERLGNASPTLARCGEVHGDDKDINSSGITQFPNL
jgi:hypothetical protein